MFKVRRRTFVSLSILWTYIPMRKLMDAKPSTSRVMIVGLCSLCWKKVVGCKAKFVMAILQGDVFGFRVIFCSRVAKLL
jgi:hypothetical protein